jgi:hypothetical protein
MLELVRPQDAIAANQEHARQPPDVAAALSLRETLVPGAALGLSQPIRSTPKAS